MESSITGIHLPPLGSYPGSTLMQRSSGSLPVGGGRWEAHGIGTGYSRIDRPHLRRRCRPGSLAKSVVRVGKHRKSIGSKLYTDMIFATKGQGCRCTQERAGAITNCTLLRRRVSTSKECFQFRAPARMPNITTASYAYAFGAKHQRAHPADL
jgi:hypothetical protein